MLVNRSLPWLLSFFYPSSLDQQISSGKTHTIGAKAVFAWAPSTSGASLKAPVERTPLLLASARRILLTDTLISALSEDEVDAIVAHELGHCALHHVRARLLLQSLISWHLYAIGLAVYYGSSFLRRNGSWNELTLVPGFFIYWSCAYVYGKSLWRCSLESRRELPISFLGR